MNVADWMTQPVLTVGVGTPLSTCAETMRKHGIRHLPVVDADGRCVSLLSDFAFEMRGLFMSGRWVAFDDEDSWLLAGDVGHGAEVVVQPDTPLSATLEALQGSYQDVAIVVDADGKPVGILTEHDVVAHAVELLPADAESAIVSRTDLPVLEDDTPAADARSWMARQRVRHVLMVDKGVLKGVLSYRDVALEDAIQHVDLAHVAKKAVSHTGPLSARQAARMLYENKFGCLPIVDAAGRPVAIVTRREILAAVRSNLEG